MPHKTCHTGAIYRMAMVGLIISLGWMLISAPSAHTQSSSILYVKPGATGNCSTWDNSCGFQESLSAAQPGDEIWVATGTYKPTSGTDRAISFNIKNGVAIYGGFAGTETLRSQRDWQANPTILSGEIGGTTGNDNSNHVIYTTGLDQSAILDGFTISSGHAFDGSELGGGMYNNASSPSLRNLIITNNYAYDGGGMYNDASSPFLQNVSFIGNQAESGGAGMENVNGSAPLLVDCVFSNQTSSFVGAGMVNSSSNPTLINVLFTQNGGLDANGGGMANFSSNPLLVNVVFWNNTAAWGGAMSNWLSNPTLVNVTIANNSAYTQGGGIYNYNNSAPLIRNSIIWGNSVISPTGVGPQIYNNPGAPVIRSTTIQGGCPAGSNCDASVLNVDPLFVNPSTGDLHLQTTSGAVNQGSNTYLPADAYDLDGDSDTTELIPYDLDQEARVLNTTVDLGAFETYINTPPVITEGDSIPYTDGLILHATDPENDPLSWSIATPPAFGSASVDPASGAVSYTPSPHCGRVAPFVVQVTDGTSVDSINILDNSGAACLWYVRASATGANNGTSWPDAFTDLQSALTAAQPCDEIWVAAGTYKPTSSTDRTISFSMKNGVAIYGGFAGTETSRDQRDWLNNPTILSGDLGGGSKSYHIIYNNGINQSAILDGFTISNGNAEGAPGLFSGAGMYNDSSSPLLRNITFTQNYAFDGGGMYNDASSPTLQNVSFTGNSAESGGAGMENVNGSAPLLIDCVFSNQGFTFVGGGMMNSSSNPTLINVLFTQNGTLDTNGGGMANFSSSPLLVNVVFWNNTAAWGGAITNWLSNPTLVNVTIANNSAYTQGGGIYNYNNSAPLIRNSIIWGNSVTASTGVGPQIYNNPGAPVIRSTTIQGGCPAGSNCDASVLNVDPLFVNPSTGDLHPQPWSGTLNQGSNTYLPADAYDLDGDSDTSEILPYDLDQQPRILNTTVDLGAFETFINTPPVITEGDSIPYTDGLVLHATDPENDPLSWSIATPPAFGSASIDPAIGAVAYTPSPVCGRVASFVVQVTDGTSTDSIEVLEGGGATCLWYVWGSAVGSNDGSSWANAFTDLQTAIGVSQTGDEIWVAAGTYKPTSGSDRAISFSMKNGVAIYGGFAGTETSRDQRDWLANPTILSGDLAGNDYPGFVNINENSRRVIYNTGLDNTAILDGFTITAGHADFESNNDTGAGMYNDSSNPQLLHLIFTNNYAFYAGGGMYNAASSPFLQDVSFIHNSADYKGGGMLNTNGSSPTLINVHFAENGILQTNGGGMFNTGSNPTLVNVVFWNNSGGQGAGIYNDLSNPTLINVTVSNNTANTQGGGIYNANNSAPLIRNSIIWGNTTSGVGPEIYNNPGAPIIRSSIIKGGCPAGSDCDASVLFVDPNFVDLPAGNVRPQLASPAHDAGSESYLPADTYDLDGDGDTAELIPYDMDHLNRILNSTVDAGAYETLANFSPVITEGDSIPYTDGLVLHATDPENDPLSWSVATPPAFGSASVDPVSGAVSYAPSPHCGRVAPFVVQVTDGTSADSIHILDGSGIVCPWFVQASATGANNGTSWPDAFTDLQSALSAAQPGDEIWVAAGTYKPTNGTDRTISFSMKNGVAIYGGFAGSETSRDQRDWLNNPTILSGDLAGNDTTGNGLPDTDEIAENSYHIFYNTGLDNTAILDGFTIRGGNANGSGYPSVGGGILNYQSSPTFANLTLAGSYALNGGGMDNAISSSPALSNVLIMNNTSYSGGGMYNTTNCSPFLNHVSFINNWAEMYGGGLRNTNGSNPNVFSTIFRQNHAGYGGGISSSSSSNPYVVNAVFFNNQANYGGGAWNDNASVTCINCSFSFNTKRAILSTNSNGRAILRNSILWGDASGELSGGTNTITNSIIQGSIGSDPLFVDAANGDLHLQPGSPAIDTGNKTLLPNDIFDLDGDGNTAEKLPYDLDSQPRVNNGMVDMGAYETMGMPFNLTEPFIEDIPAHYASLSVNNGSWANSPTSYTYQWQRAPIVEGPYSDIPEAVNPSYTTTRYDLGFFLRVLVTACNAYGCTPAFSPSVLLPNSAPVIISPPGIVSIPEDTIYTVTLTASDDDEEDELIWLISSPPAHGTVSITKSGRLRYIPNLNWQGSDSLTLVVSDGRASATTVVTLNITPLNDPPVNTLPPSIIPLTPSHTSTLTAAPGEWNDAADGSVLDAPDFQWQKADLAEGPFANIVSATAANYILTRYDFGRYLRARVTVCDQGDPGNRCTIAYSQALLINNIPPVILEDEADGLLNDDNSLTVSLTVSDAENDPLYWRIDQQPASGSATINFFTGLMHYYPHDGFSGSDTFTISASDGGASDQVIIRVSIGSPGTNERPQNSTLPVITPVDPAHLALISTDDGIWTGSGTIAYAYQWQRSSEETGPYLNLVGHTNAQYQLTRFDHGLWFRAQVNACNLAGCTSAFSLPIYVTNQTPSITNAPSSIQLSEDGYYALQMTATDGDGDLLTWFLTSSPEHGTASISLDGMLYYRPQGNWNGSDQFSIAVSDGGGSITATLSTTVAAVNDPPMNTAPPVITPSSPNHRQILQATSGTWNDAADGAALSAPTYQWQKSRNLEGPYLNITDSDSNQYTLTRFENGQYVRVRVMVCDNGNPGTLCTLVYSQPVWVANTAPVITQGDMINVSMNANGSFPVTTLSATDLENDQITWFISDPPDHGSLSIGYFNGRLSYHPLPSYSGSDTFSIIAWDGGAADQIVVQVNNITANALVEPEPLITVHYSGKPYRPGDPLLLEIQIQNAPQDMSVQLSVTLPPGAIFEPSESFTNYTPYGQSLVYTLGAGQSNADLTIPILLDPTLQDIQPLNFEVSLGSQVVSFGIFPYIKNAPKRLFLPIIFP